ncbi:UNVERIFIED_CONTAM: hypothetical protein Sradi_3880700 [Sesamum radiatum]|uniref:Uncharacterized protein n=1 Tax=Sesamum radiatum TaxID=300843 RepID=A0AAW2Q2J1_SESRA
MKLETPHGREIYSAATQKEYARDMWYQSPDNPGFSLKENCAPLQMRIGTGALRQVEASLLRLSVETRSGRYHGTV